jgi:hypothetical protein
MERSLPNAILQGLRWTPFFGQKQPFLSYTLPTFRIGNMFDALVLAARFLVSFNAPGETEVGFAGEHPTKG